MEKRGHNAVGVEECWAQPSSLIPKLDTLREQSFLTEAGTEQDVADKVPDKGTNLWQHLLLI